MYCKRCGKELVDTAKFCKYCGAPVSGQMDSPPEEIVKKGKKKWIIITIIVFVLLLIAGGAYCITSYLLHGEDDIVAREWQEQYSLGIKYLESGDYEQAILAFEEALKIEPKSVDTYLSLAEAQAAVGDEEAANETIARGIEETGDEQLAILPPQPTPAATVAPSPAQTPESAPTPAVDGAIDKNKEGVKLTAVYYYYLNDDGSTTLNRTIRYGYNEEGLLVQERQIYDDYDGEVYNLTYDEQGRLIEKSAERDYPGPETIKRKYNDENNLIYEGCNKIGDYWYDVDYEYEDNQLTTEHWYSEVIEDDIVFEHSYHEADGKLMDTRSRKDGGEEVEFIYDIDDDRILIGWDEYWDVPVEYAYVDDLYFCVQEESMTIDYETDYGIDGMEPELYTYTYAILRDNAGAEIERIDLGTSPVLEYDEMGYMIRAVNEYEVIEFTYESAEAIVPVSLETEDAQEETEAEPLPDWKQSYINYIQEDPDGEEGLTENATYWLLYINDDDIPELWIDYGFTFAGGKICTFDGEQVNIAYLWSYGLDSYIERGNMIHTWEGHMDVYWNDIYAIENGEFVQVARGDFGAIDNAAVQYDEDMNPIYQYYWNDEEVTEEEYNTRMSEVYDFSAATDTSDIDSYDYNGIIELLTTE